METGILWIYENIRYYMTVYDTMVKITKAKRNNMPSKHMLRILDVGLVLL